MGLYTFLYLPIFFGNVANVSNAKEIKTNKKLSMIPLKNYLKNTFKRGNTNNEK